jgi:glucose-1-phosphate thymidylyltransferase
MVTPMAISQHAARRREGSYIGPFTSVASDCAVIDSEIEHSIMLRGASVRGSGGSRPRSSAMRWR